MSDFDEEKVQNWRRIGPFEKPPYEERPYRECPNCGRQKFRALKAFKGGLLSSKRTEYWERCKNCKYEGDKWVVNDD